MRASLNFTSRRAHALSALCVGLAILAITLRSSASLPATWDEGDAYNRGSQLIAWLDALVRSPAGSSESPLSSPSTRELEARRYFSALGGRGALFGAEPLSAAFPHTIYREGHPPGASWTIAFGRLLSPIFGISGSTPTSYRLGFILLFASAVGTTHYRVAREFGAPTATLVAIFISTSPRLFAHAQLAGGDSLLVSSWALAWSLFGVARRSWLGSAAWGCAIAVSLSAKFSGFILPLPFALVAVIDLLRSRSRAESLAFARVAFGFAVAVALFFAFSPPLWRAPISGFATFFKLNTERAEFNIPIFFFGEFYSPMRPLPWWNGFFWPLATLPCSVLALAPFAFLRCGRRAAEKRGGDARSFWTALALAFALPIARGFPGLPVHDGSRLLIASTLFWSILAGFGARRLFALIGRTRARRLFFASLFACAVTNNVVAIVSIAPQYLSYYNELIGGVVGATRRGLEPTYYWDAFDAEVAERLRAQVDASRAAGRPCGVLFSSFSSQTLDYYAQWNVLGTSKLATISEPPSFESLDEFGYYVAQSRPSGLTPFDVAVISRAQPILVKRVKNSGLLSIFAKDSTGVVVLRVYDMRDVKRVVSQDSKKG